jgi:hypothetical protein
LIVAGRALSCVIRQGLLLILAGGGRWILLRILARVIRWTLLLVLFLRGRLVFFSLVGYI